jgi:hypothetical protein
MVMMTVRKIHRRQNNYPQAGFDFHPVATVLGWGAYPMTWQSELEALIQETQAHANAVKTKILRPIAPAKLVEQAPAESSRPARLEPMCWAPSGSEREEIKRRVANFKAVQDRMQREREDYFVKTLADACQVPRVAPAPRQT